MITGLDHIALEVADVAGAAASYAAVLGRQAIGGRLQLDNTALVLLPRATTASSDAMAVIGLVLSAADVAETARRLSRRALPASGAPGEHRYDIAPDATHGVAIGVVAARESAAPAASHDIAGLDHVVVRTPDPERAVALYGGRLGLDLRLDRSNPAYGSRMLFFVCGGLVVEVTHDLAAGIGTGPDVVRGLAWRARDIEVAHARMQAASVEVSQLRSGRRPGTQVFTVKSHTAGVPTLVIGGEGLERA